MDFNQASKGYALAHIMSIFFTFQSPGRGYIKKQSKFQSKTLFSQIFISIFNVMFLANSLRELSKLATEWLRHIYSHDNQLRKQGKMATKQNFSNFVAKLSLSVAIQLGIGSVVMLLLNNYISAMDKLSPTIFLTCNRWP